MVAGVAEYAKRLQRDCRFTIIETRTADRKKDQPVARYQEEEGRGLISSIVPGARVVALDLGGNAWSTEDLAGKLEQWSQQAGHVQFLIGGPDGLSAQCLALANEHFALSRLTFPHFMVRVMLAEQLYRALMVNNNHPYHK